mmetsp:Transcript_30010/g.94603  ORF Transcript_30010/g.94603 Transcript_30010/m.94603 type:complete len:256 (-) Transcript_30010:159-926(-)
MASAYGPEMRGAAAPAEGQGVAGCSSSRAPLPRRCERPAGCPRRGAPPGLGSRRTRRRRRLREQASRRAKLRGDSAALMPWQMVGPVCDGEVQMGLYVSNTVMEQVVIDRHNQLVGQYVGEFAKFCGRLGDNEHDLEAMTEDIIDEYMSTFGTKRAVIKEMRYMMQMREAVRFLRTEFFATGRPMRVRKQKHPGNHEGHHPGRHDEVQADGRRDIVRTTAGNIGHLDEIDKVGLEMCKDIKAENIEGEDEHRGKR